MNTMLTLKLMEYKDIISTYRKQKSSLRKATYVSEINNIRSNIIDNLTNEDLSFEKLFSILKKYEKHTSFKMTFSVCRYSCYDDIHVDETIVDALKIAKKYGFGISEKLVSFFPKHNYDIEKEEFVVYNEIKPSEVIDADSFVVLEYLKKYKKDYQKIVTLIINYLLSEF